MVYLSKLALLGTVASHSKAGFRSGFDCVGVRAKNSRESEWYNGQCDMLLGPGQAHTHTRYINRPHLEEHKREDEDERRGTRASLERRSMYWGWGPITEWTGLEQLTLGALTCHRGPTLLPSHSQTRICASWRHLRIQAVNIYFRGTYTLLTKVNRLETLAATLSSLPAFYSYIYLDAGYTVSEAAPVLRIHRTLQLYCYPGTTNATTTNAITNNHQQSPPPPYTHIHTHSLTLL